MILHHSRQTCTRPPLDILHYAWDFILTKLYITLQHILQSKYLIGIANKTVFTFITMMASSVLIWKNLEKTYISNKIRHFVLYLRISVSSLVMENVSCHWIIRRMTLLADIRRIHYRTVQMLSFTKLLTVMKHYAQHRCWLLTADNSVHCLIFAKQLNLCKTTYKPASVLPSFSHVLVFRIFKAENVAPLQIQRFLEIGNVSTKTRRRIISLRGIYLYSTRVKLGHSWYQRAFRLLHQYKDPVTSRHAITSSTIVSELP